METKLKTPPTSSVSIDWLSCTFKHDNPTPFHIVAAFDDFYPRKKITGLHGYDVGMRWEHGAMLFMHTQKPEMGVHLQMSGDPIAAMEYHGFDALFMLNRMLAGNGKFTRIDLALDLFDYDIHIPDYYAMLEERQYKGRTKGGSMIMDTVKGQTLYAGSWHSARFYRLYDKAKETKTDINWKRLELILKEKYALALQWEYSKNPSLEYLGKVMKGTVKTMTDFDNEVWKAILEGDTEKLSLPRSIPADTRKWLLTQVCPAIANYIMRHDDKDILDDMQNEITEILKLKWK